MKKSQPNKHEIEELLIERKTHAYSQLKERFEKIQSTINRLATVRTQPREFIKSYFDDMRALIDAKADEAKQRVENERLKLVAAVKSFEDRCAKEAEEIDKTQGSSVDKLSNKFTTEYNHWKENFSSDVRINFSYRYFF